MSSKPALDPSPTWFNRFRDAIVLGPVEAASAALVVLVLGYCGIKDVPSLAFFPKIIAAADRADYLLWAAIGLAMALAHRMWQGMRADRSRLSAVSGRASTFQDSLFVRDMAFNEADVKYPLPFRDVIMPTVVITGGAAQYKIDPRSDGFHIKLEYYSANSPSGLQIDWQIAGILA